MIPFLFNLNQFYTRKERDRNKSFLFKLNLLLFTKLFRLFEQFKAKIKSILCAFDCMHRKFGKKKTTSSTKIEWRDRKVNVK